MDNTTDLSLAINPLDAANLPDNDPRRYTALVGSRCSVTDAQGGVWIPDEGACDEAERAKDMGAALVRLCITQPHRGTWHQ